TGFIRSRMPIWTSGKYLRLSQTFCNDWQFARIIVSVPAAPRRVRVAFLDVGQADTIVVSSPDTAEAIVVDCVDADAVLRYLAHEGIRYLRGVVISHLHADHWRGVDSLLQNCHQVANMSECEVLAFNNIFNRAMYEQLVRDPDDHSSEHRSGG